MIEKWIKSLDAGGAFKALLTDLSKTFDCLPHELLIAKLHAYGIVILSLKLLHSYLTKWKQRVKLNGVYSSWSKIQHISMRLILIFPWRRYCKLCRRQHSKNFELSADLFVYHSYMIHSHRSNKVYQTWQ